MLGAFSGKSELDDNRLEVSPHAAEKAQVSAHSKQPPIRGGNPSPCNMGDPAGGKPKDKGTPLIKGKHEAMPDKPKLTR
jgi:hypothetical protein